MGRITFVEYSGKTQDVDIEVGKSLMEVAVENGISGIDADCGGLCICGTCHVILEQAALKLIGQVESDEVLMLELNPERTSTSRLACQIRLTEDMAGMIVRLPEYQN